MATAVDSLINQIRTAVYGREVRTAIADAILQCYDKTATTFKIDGVGHTTTINRFAVCTTSGVISAKTASITGGSFTLEKGARVTVLFTYNNESMNPTLNINGTGARAIFHRGICITNAPNLFLLSGACDFVYDGVQWNLIGNFISSNGDSSGNVPIDGLENYLTKTEASNTYLTRIIGDNIYLKRSEINIDDGGLVLSDYMTRAELANTYLSLAGADTNYVKKIDITEMTIPHVICTNDATKIPKGIKTPNGITGFLLPSADTLGRIYLVPTYESNGSRYDEYITVHQNDEYIWEKLGGDLDTYTLLTMEEIPGTIQSITFTEDGEVSQIKHLSGNIVRRTDDFTFTDDSVIEVRTLPTGESLTITTNTNTLQTSTYYSAA